MKFFSKLLIGFVCGVALSHFGWAAEKLNNENPDLVVKITQALESRFPGAKINLLTTPQCQGNCVANHVELVQENGTGVADFRYSFLESPNRLDSCKVQFTAQMPTWIAKRRVRPGEKLTHDDFEKGSVDVSRGLAYQYRGVMLNEATDIDSLQARLTILEGQYPLSNGVEKVPSVRKGDIVQVKLTSGDIQLMTQAVAQEPGYEEQKIRVITQKGKRELTGMLKEGGIVEVRL